MDCENSNTGEKPPIVGAAINADGDFGVALTEMPTEVIGSNFILPRSVSEK